MYKNKRSGKSVVTSYAGETVEDNRFKKLIENGNDGITLLDKDFQVIYRSASAERISGWSAVNRAKYGMNDLIHPDDVGTVNDLLNNVLTNPGVPETGHFRSKHFDGHYIWLECTYTNFLNDCDINAIVCNFRDISGRRQAEDALTYTVKELFTYKYALDESAIVAITDQKGIIKHVNENFCRISKYSEAELIGKDHRIINSGYHGKAFIRNLWLTIARGDIWKGEIKNKTKDGSYYWVDTTIVPFLNDSGKPYQYAAIRSDITERKLNQDKIIESESFIKTITDNLPVMIAYWNADLNCLFANKPYMDWFEKQPDEMFGINKRDLLDKDEFKLHEMHIKNVLNGSPQRFERTFHRIDGRTINTDTQYLPDIERGIVKGFYSLIYDVTEVKQALEERNTILESIDDAFFAVDKNWVVTYWNKMAERVLRTPKNKVLNHNLWEIFSDSINSESYKKYHEAVESSQAMHFEDYYEPIEKWYEISAYPSDTGLSVYFKDITDRKRTDIRLREMNETLQKHSKELAISNAELEQFAYVASHDLQEPLRMVTSFMTQLEKKYGDVVDDKGRQYIHFAVDGAKRMRQIILDLLDFSRVGRTEDDLEEVDFNKLINEILALHRRQIEELKATIIFKDLPKFQNYKTPMRQVFQNLISNSLKYHKAGEPPVIEIACKENAANYQFSVKDNGIGIASEYFDRIFIIFQRLHNKDEYSGTGMGLAIAKKIIENLGGKIWVKSEEGKGSAFYFTLLKSKKT
jgi:PAS domain S-box-containing protein